MTTLNIYRVVPYMLLSLGLISLLGSFFVSSYVLAFIGLGLAFWGALLLYLTPSKYVKLELLSTTASSALSNIERILAAAESASKGVYLPPKLLRDYQSSLVFIPLQPNGGLPKPEETDEEKLYSGNPRGLLLTPPGLALSRLLEKKLGKSFLETDLSHLQKELPRLFEELEIAKDLTFENENKIVKIEMTNHIFKGVCEETRKLRKTHQIVGCPLSSAIACALAKSTGKPVTIESEKQDGRTTKIQYRMLEG